jgi:glutathione S-transferase
MADIIFYTLPQSRGQIVRWMLEELGEPYDTVIPEFPDGLRTPEYLAINPMGKVPAIRHKDTVVTEGAAICAYLADAFPAAGLAPPPQDPRRGPYYRWLFFAAGPLEAAVTGKALGLLAPPERRGTVGYGTFEDTVATLESAVAGRDYICGDQFTAADVFVGSHIKYGKIFGILPDGAAFADYLARLEQRPAWKRAQEIDAAAMPKQEAETDA